MARLRNFRLSLQGVSIFRVVGVVSDAAVSFVYLPDRLFDIGPSPRPVNSKAHNDRMRYWKMLVSLDQSHKVPGDGHR